jgi:predicted O-methyltransferase YrrM
MTLKPYMPQQEIAVIDLLMHAIHPRRVLEYGAGGSTLRWSKVRTVEEWLAVEHSEEWYRKVAQEARPPVRMLTGSATDATDYVDAPGIDGWFDLILVDGLWRVECVRESVKRLQPWGVVLLHDAGRHDYDAAWDVYPGSVLLTKGTEAANGLLALWGNAWDR